LLPAVIGWLGIARHRAEEFQRERAAELAARFETMDAALEKLEQIARERGVPEDVAALLRARQEHRRQLYPRNLTDGVELATLGATLRLELIAAEREFLVRLFRDGKLNDESRRRIERELDLEEAAIACKKEGDALPL
jgi:CPA1 family monovalent cation:H+ antiporter